jgi:hypothetical protein
MNDSIQDVLSRLDSAANPGRKLHVLLIGDRDNIVEEIYTLYAIGYAEVGAWSPLLTMPNSTKMMSILTRGRSAQSAASTEPS